MSDDTGVDRIAAELDHWIAAADALDGDGAELLGYAVRVAAHTKHKGVNPYRAEDRRNCRFRQGQSRALNEIEEDLDKLLPLLHHYRPDTPVIAGQHHPAM